MVKIKAFLTAVVLVILTFCLIGPSYMKTIDNYYVVKDNSVRYNTSYEKYKSYDILTKNIDENTLVFLGSSELTATLTEDFHPRQVFNYDDFHVMQIGGGYYQNLIQAATLGSIGSHIPHKQVVISESIQWFSDSKIDGEMFLSRLSQEHVYNTMANPQISKETKQEFIDRVLEISQGNPKLHSIYKEYKDKFINQQSNPLEDLKQSFLLEMYKFRIKHDFYHQHLLESLPLKGTKTPDYDWNELFAKEIDEAKLRTNNNDFAVENHYYDTYMRDKYHPDDPGKSQETFSSEQEFKDLKIFLDIAHDLNIDVTMVVFPVNGKWYDYTGIKKETRDAFSNKIQTVAMANNVHLLDYTDKDYEKYFLFDVMHAGWGGWTTVEKEIYNIWKDKIK